MLKKNFKKLKKKQFHPITTYLLYIIGIMILSAILSLFKVQSTYNVINQNNLGIEQVTVAVRNILNFAGLKELISNTAVNFMSFTPLSAFLISAIGLAICEASGFFEVLFKKKLTKINSKFITFMIIFIATISTLINEIGFVILIPLAAILFKLKGRNPLAGVCAAFAGVAFGTGTTIFVGSTEVLLIPYTTAAARIIDSSYHVSLLSNIFIMIVSSIVLSIVGTFIVEKFIVPKCGKYKEKKVLNEGIDVEIIDFNEDPDVLEQKILGNDYKEKRGLKYAFIVSIIFILFFIYSVIPGLPFSGLLLDVNETTYLKQIFGSNSYFQDGFTYMISLLFLLTGIAYGIGSKKFSSDKDIVNEATLCLSHLGEMIFLIFVASQFVAIFKMTNISAVITSIMTNLLNSIPFGGIPFLIISFLVIGFTNIFQTGIQAKWIAFSPVVVAVLMKSNVSPQFAQFMMRAADSITNGITPLYAYFVIFIGYLNFYNQNKEKPITIMKAVKLMMPYFVIISITWLLILLGWYIIGLPIGPGVYPTI